MEFLTILPNLSIGVVSVLGLAYVSLKHSQTQKESEATFLKAMDERAQRHEGAMQEREQALRMVEKEIRSELVPIISDSRKVMERVIHHLDKH